MRWHGSDALLGLDYRDAYAIDCAWFMCSNDKAIIVAFRGADPLLQMDRRSDIPTALVHVQGGAFNRRFSVAMKLELLYPAPHCLHSS